MLKNLILATGLALSPYKVLPGSINIQQTFNKTLGTQYRSEYSSQYVTGPVLSRYAFNTEDTNQYLNGTIQNKNTLITSLRVKNNELTVMYLSYISMNSNYYEYEARITWYDNITIPNQNNLKSYRVCHNNVPSITITDRYNFPLAFDQRYTDAIDIEDQIESIVYQMNDHNGFDDAWRTGTNTDEDFLYYFEQNTEELFNKYYDFVEHRTNSNYYEGYIQYLELTYSITGNGNTITNDQIDIYANMFTGLRQQINVNANYVPRNIVIDTEVIDLPGLLFTILGMPFAWISTGFNLTLFPGTPYSLNIGTLILGVIGLLIGIFIIRKLIK